MDNKNMNVIVVDDELMVRLHIEDIVKEIGYNVLASTHDGNEAIELIHTHKPDLVLLDIEMPNINGLTVCRMIQEKCPVPVIVLTSYDSKEYIKSAADYGAGAYLLKPLERNELERAAEIAVARHKDFVALIELNDKLNYAKNTIKRLKSRLPICSVCKKIRDEDNKWIELEEYIEKHSKTKFSHGICNDCANKLYPEIMDKIGNFNSEN